jgi:hypothetical protein
LSFLSELLQVVFVYKFKEICEDLWLRLFVGEPVANTAGIRWNTLSFVVIINDGTNLCKCCYTLMIITFVECVIFMCLNGFPLVLLG